MTSETTGRWRPNRAGILNVWRYYDEVFTFHRGRLLLRGPNGSGKSKALELLLPYLLDADLSPRRLSTFGSGTSRTMYWNLMGEGVEGSTRSGYLWVEFAHDDGTHFTCGVRLSASKNDGNKRANPKYFTTTARIGEDLTLIDSQKQALSLKELEKALVGNGQLLDRDSYRETVRKRLFANLSPERYTSLINALLQLRTPKLSELLDPGTLSTMLSQALPPLAEDELAEIAEGFERLDRRTDRLAELTAQRDAAQRLDRSQRTFAQRVVRTAADAATGAESRRERATATVKQHAEGLEAVKAAVAAHAAEIETAEGEEVRAQAEVETLTQDPAYNAGKQLETEETQAARLRDEAGRRQADLLREQRRLGEFAERYRRAAGQAKEADRAVERGVDEARSRSEASGMGVTWSALVETVPEEAKRLLAAAVKAAKRDIEACKEASRAWSAASDRRDTLEDRRDELRERHDDAIAAQERAGVELEDAHTDLAAAMEDWAAGCVEHVFDDDAVTALAEARSRAEAGEVAGGVYAAAAERLAGARSRAQGRLDECGTALAAEKAELERLESETQLAPDRPSTRGSDRTDKTGAPLWRSVDFTEGLTESEQAGVEAALEASGLLDAWINPDGSIETDDEDTVVGIASPVSRPLSRLLRPDTTGELEPAVVASLLDGIAVEPDAAATAVITADGSWRLGNAAGRWSKTRSKFIGATARERHRAEQIALTAARVAAAEQSLKNARVALTEIEMRRTRLDAEAAAIPGFEAVESRQTALAAAEQRVSTAFSRLTDVEGEIAESERKAREAHLALIEFASRHRLPTAMDELGERGEAVDSFNEAAREWIDALAEASRRREALAGLDADRAEQEERTGEAAEAATEAAAEAEAKDHAVRALRDSLGDTYDELLERIGRAKRWRKALHERLTELRKALSNAQIQATRTEKDLEAAQQQQTEAARVRDREFAAFRSVLTGQLGADARLETDLADDAGVGQTLEAARRAAEALASAETGEAPVNRAMQRLNEVFQEQRPRLASFAELAFRETGRLSILTAEVGGVRIGPRALYDRLAAAHQQAKEELSADEQQLFTDILTGQARDNFARRIREANRIIKQMNERLSGVKTASRVSVKLRWQVREELDELAKEARDLFLLPPEKLTEAQEGTLRRFLGGRVDALRDSDDPQPWSLQLQQVFDYTAWHEFKVLIDRGEGWKPLSKRLHSALSGGEKAIALHLPLFAAVAAHYETAPAAPRLILLDEVFVGVDRANRGQIFGLMSSLGLDMVLTSDHEWGEYAELDGIAVHQILRGGEDDGDAVTTVRYTWDGFEMVPDEDEDLV
ncbi:TIGR02680 family protein [Glycomyces sp. A-F 0318]|uniref:TIGR02680 family protein n=1 Tax=Glycomyces amatae TaxID=2881355 RepID=UPI001E2BC9AC|nr:TIGR02680 family protein [Glycomyces amatae]